jgi:alkanesulfonate monooxygenase SsuD/methylene tetrahydromethanopterin reductase-like flavin-dependent oxidoreductase (luciferase family)
MPPIRFSLAYPPQNVSWSDYLAVVTAADRTTYETFWTFDHLFTIGGNPDGLEHECYVTMAALAQATRRIRIGALVTGVVYRNPALQIKMATQIDVLSNGRFDFGIGAGWAERPG